MVSGASETSWLASVSSVAGVVMRYVDDMVPVGPGYLSEWLAGLRIPPGWRTAHLADRNFEPARILVFGQHPEGSWDACETISAFGFTGTPPEHVVHSNASRTLCDLGATGIATQSVGMSSLRGAAAVRSSGYFATAGLWVWAQYSTYVFGSTERFQGRLIEHAVFVDSVSQTRLSADVAVLTRAVEHELTKAAATS